MQAGPREMPAFLRAQGAQFLQINTLTEPGNTSGLERRLKGICRLNFLLQPLQKCYSCMCCSSSLGELAAGDRPFNRKT